RDVEAGAREDPDHPPQRARDGMESARQIAALRKRDVEPLGRELRIEALGLERPPPRVEDFGDSGFRLVDFLTRSGTLLGRQAPEHFQPLGKEAFLAEILDADRVELLQVPGRAYLRLRFAQQ